jgi:hypothetical protein
MITPGTAQKNSANIHGLTIQGPVILHRIPGRKERSKAKKMELRFYSPCNILIRNSDKSIHNIFFHANKARRIRYENQGRR